MRAPEFWRHDGPLATALAPLALAFDGVGRVRRALIRPWRAPLVVICVGNLVAGGAGKTPVALAIGVRLAARGVAVHFLTRGHGGRTRGPLAVDPARHDAALVGDEALLLAAVAPTWVARDRPAGAARAAAAGAEAVVMDDGYQNPSLVKDLAIVVVDGDYGFGNRRVMPAGPLREAPGPGLVRADAVVLIGEGQVPVGLYDGRPLLRATLAPTPAARALAKRRVVAFAGIGRPEKFFATLKEMSCEIVAAHAFADHHRYDADEIMRLVEAAAALDATPVTTAKDFVRLPAEARPMVEPVPVTLAWRRPEALDRLLDGLDIGVVAR